MWFQRVRRSCRFPIPHLIRLKVVSFSDEYVRPKRDATKIVRSARVNADRLSYTLGKEDGMNFILILLSNDVLC